MSAPFRQAAPEPEADSDQDGDEAQQVKSW